MSYHPNGRYPKPQKGWRSGFCPLDAREWQHEKCLGVNPNGVACICDCHQPEPEEDDMTTTDTSPGAPAPTFDEPPALTRQDNPAESGTGTGPGEAQITEPGLVFDMSDETYHSDPVPGGSLSSSFARRLTEYVPAKAFAAHHSRKPTASMNLGKAAHLHALGAGPELIVWEHDGRTKAGKEERAKHAADVKAERVIAVKEDERDQVLGMAAALRADPEVAAILDAGTPEVSVFWQERGAWCRGRFDLLGEVGDDYKTTDDASPRGFEKAMSTYGYHQQADFYLRGLRAIGHPAGERPMRFICQEKQYPYLVQIHTCDDLSMEIAAALNDRAIDVYAEAKRTGEWAGYPSLHAEPTSLPSRYFYRYGDLLPDHLNPYAEPGMSI